MMLKMIASCLKAPLWLGDKLTTRVIFFDKSVELEGLND